MSEVKTLNPKIETLDVEAVMPVDAYTISTWLKVLGSGFRVSGLGFRVSGEGFWVQGSWFRVQGLGFGVQGEGFRISTPFSRVFIVNLGSVSVRWNLRRGFSLRLWGPAPFSS